ncbi:MAG: DNRLRE domain-containing protein [Promethearchaeota archaeon]
MLQKIHHLFRKSSTRTFSFFFIFTLVLQIYGFFGVDGSPNLYPRVVCIAEADSYVDSTAPSRNHGFADGLQIWKTETAEQLIILRFDIPYKLLPDSLAFVVLQLQTGVVLTSYLVEVYGCNNTTWDEAEVTFNNFPLPPYIPLDTQNVGSDFYNYSWDVSSWIEDNLMVDEKLTFILQTDTIRTGFDLISFISREGTQKGLGSPPLLIFYSEDPPAPTSAPATTSPLADDPTYSLIASLFLTGLGFFIIIFLFLLRSPSPPSPVLPRKSPKPPPSIESEARNDIIFTPLAKKLYETTIEKPPKPVAPEPMDLDSEIIPTPKERRSFFCQIDGQKHPATDSAYECEKCSRNVCASCHESSKVVGISACPFCQGRLIRIQ